MVKGKQYSKLYIYNLDHFLLKFFTTLGSMCCIGHLEDVGCKHLCVNGLLWHNNAKTDATKA